MANTYSQISIQAVFVVKGRDNIITKDWRDELDAYISGILEHIGAKPLAVGGWKDHVHIFFGMSVTANIADILRSVEANSSKWIKEKRFVKSRFEWQPGYAAFSYSRSQRDLVINYIMNQEQHHRIKTFKEEYFELLTKFEIEYYEEYLFEFYD